jgi:hypothetical protein
MLVSLKRTWSDPRENSQKPHSNGARAIHSQKDIYTINTITYVGAGLAPARWDGVLPGYLQVPAASAGNRKGLPLQFIIGFSNDNYFYDVPVLKGPTEFLG